MMKWSKTFDITNVRSVILHFAPLAWYCFISDENKNNMLEDGMYSIAFEGIPSDLCYQERLRLLLFFEWLYF